MAKAVKIQINFIRIGVASSRFHSVLISSLYCFVYVLLLMIASCGDTNNAYGIKIDELSNYIRSLTDAKKVYVIPATGCGGCINEAMRFVKKNYKSKDLYIIITRVNDTKVVKNWLGSELLGAANLYIDKTNKIGSFGYSQIYPFTVEWDGNKISEILFLEAQNIEITNSKLNNDE